MPNLTQEQLRSDLTHLVALPTSTLLTLLSSPLSSSSSPSSISSPQPPSTPPQPTSPSPYTAIDILNTYSPSTSTPESSTTLSKAYIREMREILPVGVGCEGDSGAEGERLGERIDLVREKGEGVAKALEAVKI